jgi:hypothetical protein
MENKPRLHACATDVDGGAVGAHAKLVLSWKIAPDGSIHDVAVVSSTSPGSDLEQCVLAGVRTFVFPSADGPTNVSQYPFKF